ncbi:hypothetical protein ACIRBX_04930 [Kitasatospora sp. NPDC096147]|uniref:hypothetical protein n=1 Tax=Kitasatospora sp. NPDC096147 TaxID=3364093 RepID=UPI0037F404A3
MYVAPAAMAAYDHGYELLSDLTVIPIGVAGVVCSVALVVLRPRGVPLGRVLTGLLLQLSVFVGRAFLWGSWAEQVREAGAVRPASGALHPAYLRYVDTHWIRIALITGYALPAFVMAVPVAGASSRAAAATDG